MVHFSYPHNAGQHTPAFTEVEVEFSRSPNVTTHHLIDEPGLDKHGCLAYAGLHTATYKVLANPPGEPGADCGWGAAGIRFDYVAGQRLLLHDEFGWVCT